MQKAQTTVAPSNTMTVSVARFGYPTQAVTVPVGSSVQYVLQMSNLSLEGNEEMFVEGERATEADILENGDVLSVVTPKQAG